MYCGGRLGMVQFKGPLLRVAVHPGGLVIKPLFLPAFAVAAGDITAIRHHDNLFLWGLEVAHASPQVVSPLRLGCDERSAVAEALRSIAAATVARPAR
jgi:hypothetical protein